MDDTETVDAEGFKESAEALAVKLPDGRMVWIPKSVIHDDSEVWKPGQKGKLVVLRWFAEKEGIE